MLSADPLVTIQKVFQEGKNHLRTSLMHNFIYNKEDLSSDEIAEVEEHMDGCDRCRDQIDEVQSNKNLYANAPSLE